MTYAIHEERLTPEAYIAFLRRTDLGVVREWTGRGVGKALVRELHRIAGESLAGGGEDNIIMYTCANENATGFYEKLGMVKPNDIYMYNKVEWTDFTVE